MKAEAEHADERLDLLDKRVVLASLGFGFHSGVYEAILMYAVAALTILSMVFYLAEWTRHLSTTEPLQ